VSWLLQVLKVNNYQMNEGGISAWEESTGGYTAQQVDLTLLERPY